MSKQVFFLALVALICFFASSYAFAEDSNVIVLTTDTFDEVVKKTEFTLIEFYAPWCPHCKSLEPEYEKAATLLKGSGVQVAKIDCDKETKIAQQFQIPGFPTIKLFKNGKPFRDFEEERKGEVMAKWVQKKTGPSAKVVSSKDELNKLIADETADEANPVTLVVGFFASKDSDAYKQFSSAADNTDLEDFTFVEVTGATATQIAGKDTVKLYRHFEPKEVTLSGSITEEEIKNFVKQNGYPLVDEINAKSFRRFADAGVPLAVAFLDYTDVNAKKEFVSMLTRVAEKIEGKMVFGVSDGKVYGQQLEIMGGDKSHLPGIAAMDIQKRLNYPLSSSVELNEKNVLEWAQKIASGKAEPYVRSQPIPEKNDEPVKVVVGKTFDDIVLDSTKDVLVEFYAPWCGHCKKLAPTFDKLAEYHGDVKDLVIAKVDSTENDITSVQVEGFPTIMFFPSDNKNAPITYEGDRTLKSLKQFIRKNAVASKDAIQALREKLKAEKTKKKDEL